MAEPKFVDAIYQLRPWYHDFAALGVQTIFPDSAQPLWKRGLRNARRLLRGQKPYPRGTHRADHFVINQQCKEPYLRAFMQEAFAALGEGARVLDLFCADGYYSFVMATLTEHATITGVDLNARDIQCAQVMGQVLGQERVTFVAGDVFEVLPKTTGIDFIFCAGGLYHLAAPYELIALMRERHPIRLLIQSVVTLETEDKDYFVTPAPGWKHGSRFTHARLRNWILESGLDVLDEARNELEGNPAKQDRGSSYFLCSGGG